VPGLSLGAARLSAQHVVTTPVVLLGSEAEERVRLRQLLGETGSGGFMLRSSSTLSPRALDRGWRLEVFDPELRSITNSSIPFSLNDGPLWAGRGANSIVTAGLGLTVGSVRVIVAPQFVAAENQAFQVIPYPQNNAPRRSVWANPFHPPESSIDLPYRFGDASIRHADAGQSSLSIGVRHVSFGIATENLWWGPGVRNAIVLSNNAPGFPHAFVQTRNGVRTRIGTFDAQWILGQLHESDFFDTDRSNDLQSLSGLVVVWRPRSDSGLSLGIARTVFAPAEDRRVSPSAAFDVFRNVGRPNTDPDAIAKGPGPDQLFSLFGRWVFPSAGFETYVEWARFEEPISFRDFLEFPNHSQGYTLGLQWARPMARGATFRLQAEATYLEPDPSLRVRPVAMTYTSRSVVQGYTNRGKLLGASIGPGASSQWLSADVFGGAFRLGMFAGRIRWDNATLWLPIVPDVKNEDVSLMGGLRGSLQVFNARLTMEYTNTVRLDYLFQDKIADYARGTHSGVDINNRTLSIGLSTAVVH
jgi:hypothetical protein